MLEPSAAPCSRVWRWMLWGVLALAASASGLPYVRGRDQERVQRWTLVMILVFATLGATVFAALVGPMLKIQTTLSDR